MWLFAVSNVRQFCLSPSLSLSLRIAFFPRYLLEVPLASVAITHLTPHTLYSGAYPTAPLKDGAHGGFSVNVTVHLWVPPGGATGALAVAGSWATNENTGNGDGDDGSTFGDTVGNGIRKGNGDSNNALATSDVLVLPAGESKISLQLTATAKQIKLWWPSGVGAQPLYDVTATWTPASSPSEDAVDRVGATAPASTASPSSPPSTSTATRRMGFRVFALVTVNDTNATVVASNASGQVNATGTHGMFFRVNGAALYSRGVCFIKYFSLYFSLYSVYIQCEGFAKLSFYLLSLFEGQYDPYGRVGGAHGR